MNLDDYNKLDLSEIMHKIPLSQIPQWRVEEEHWLPTTIDTICGICNCPTTLVTDKAQRHAWTSMMVMTGRCVRCQADSRVWAIEVKHRNSTTGKKCSEVWVLPKPQIREPIALQEDTPVRISKAYKDATDAFNAGMYSLAITACGRVLEAIAKTTFPGGSGQRQIGTLFKTLETSLGNNPEYKELLQPLLDIGRTLRVGRNTGAHFDLEKDPDRDVAIGVLDLTEFLLKYIYLIRGEAQEVDEKIEQLSPGE